MHKKAWPGTGVMYWAIAACAVPTYALSTALPQMAVDLGVTLAQAGLVYAAASVGSFLLLMGSAFVVARRGEEPLFAVALGLLLLGITGFVLIPSYGWLLAAGAVLNGASAVTQVMSFALLAQRHAQQVVRYQNVAGIFWSAGAVLSPLLTGYLIGAGPGWRWAFGLSAAIAAGALALLLAEMAGSRRQRQVSASPGLARAGDGTAQPGRSPAPGRTGKAVLGLLRRREFDLVVLGFLCYLGAEITITGWISSFLTEVQHAPAVLAGLGLALFWAGMGLGRLVVAAVLAQRLSAPRLLMLAMGSGAVVMVAASLSSGVAAALVLFALAGLCFSAGAPTLSGFLATLFPGLSGPAMSLYYSLGQVGAVIFPALAGVVAAGFGFRVGLAMPAALALGVVGVATWFDRQSRRAVGLGADDGVGRISKPASLTPPGPPAEPPGGLSTDRPVPQPAPVGATPPL